MSYPTTPPGGMIYGQHCTVLITDTDFRVVANPVTNYSQVSVELKFNEVGTGELVAPADDWLVEAVGVPGRVILVLADRRVFAGGPIEKPGAIEWGADAGVGQLKVNFATHEAYLARRLTYPDPAAAGGVGTVPAWAATNTNAEQVMRTLVNLNAGPGALAVRRVPRLMLGALANVGVAVTVSTRYALLTDALREVAAAGGGLGFQVRYDAADLTLKFEVYAPRDRSAQVRFSRALGNLRSFATDPEAPTATVALIGGDGTGTGRAIIEATNPAAAGWGRMETFVNQATTAAGLAELAQAGAVALAEAGPRLGVAATATDSPQASYGVDYHLGDRVGIEVVPGQVISDLVTGVTLTCSAETGLVITPTIGSANRNDPGQIALLRELNRRLARLERF